MIKKEIREYIIETYGGIPFKWRKRTPLLWYSPFHWEGDDFETLFHANRSDYRSLFTKVAPELDGLYWFIDFRSTSGFTFGRDAKSIKAVHVIINQMKEIARSTYPEGFIFKTENWDILRLFKAIIPTMVKVLGYRLYEKKQIAYTHYFILRR